MAKAEVTLTCPSCGKEFTKTKNCYNRREADSWEEWMKGQEGNYVCPSCYSKQMREKEKQAADDLENKRKERRGIDSWAVKEHGLPEFDTSKEGNFASSIRGRMIELANEHGAKDEFWEILKSIPADGKLWCETINTSFGSYMSDNEIEKDWNLYDVEKWITRLQKATEAKTDKEQLKKDLDELFPMPEIPHIRDLCGVSSTARWNGKFYGRDGCQVYMDGERYTITPQQKKDWEEGQKKIAEWKAQREKYEREHNAERYGNTIGRKFTGVSESTKITLTLGQIRKLVNGD